MSFVPLSPGGADLRFHSPQPWHHSKLQVRGHGASVSHGVLVYSPAYNGPKLYCKMTEAMCVNNLPKVAYLTVQQLEMNLRSPIASPVP